MIKIRFADAATERQALGFLAGRFSVKTWSNGETLVPIGALSALSLEGIGFSVACEAGCDSDFKSLS